MPNFKDLNLKVNNETAIAVLDNGVEVEVREYLPIEDKIDLIQITLQKAEEDGIYNDIKLDVYFHLNIVYLYSNIIFTDEEKADEMELYDRLESNNVFLSIVGAMKDNEYEVLRDYLEIAKEDALTYGNSAAAVLRRIVTDLPKNAAAAKEIVDSFNPDQYQEVINFASAANGGRNINMQTAPVSPAAPDIEIPPKRKVVKIESATKKD